MQFSIIMPVYNAQNVLDRSIGSILQSGFKDWELIVIDDGSKDDSVQVCKKYAGADERVRLIEMPQNGGPSAARNAGINAAKGKYILFADSDDWIEPGWLEAVNSVIEKDASCFPVFGYWNDDTRFHGTNEQITLSQEEMKIQDPVRLMELLYGRNLLGQLWNKCFSARILKQNNLRFDESIRIGEDMALILGYLQAVGVGHLKYYPGTYYHYMRDQNTSLMFQVGGEQLQQDLKNRRNMLTLEGMDENTINQQLQQEEQEKKTVLAYLIMHNRGMSSREKYRMIQTVDPENGNRLFLSQLKLVLKENAKKALSRFGGGNQH